MRNLLLPLLFIWCNVLTAQDDIIDPQYIWTEVHFSWVDAYSASYRYDTMAVEQNGKVYFEILSSNLESGGNWEGTGILIRSEGRKLYQGFESEEYLLIDFDLEPGDTILHFYGSPMTIVTVDSIMLQNGITKKRMGVYCDVGNPPGIPWFYWIDGIGSTTGLVNFGYTCAFDVGSALLCLYHDDTLLFDHEEYDSCWIEYVSTAELEKNGISFYPNPVEQTLSIDDPNGKVLKVWITDLSGNVVLITTNEKINTSVLSPGAYILNFELTTGKRVSEKIIRM